MLLFHSRNGIGGSDPNGAEGEKRHFACALLEQASATDFDGFHGASPVASATAATRIADDERMFRLLLRGEHEVAQLALVVGRSNDKMRYGAQGGNVENPMVGGTRQNTTGKSKSAVSWMMLS